MSIPQSVTTFRQRAGRVLVPGVALFLAIAVMASYEEDRASVAFQKDTGLGAVSPGEVGWDVTSLWRQQSLGAVAGGAPGVPPGSEAPPPSPMMASARIRSAASPSPDDRKIVRSCRMELVVANPSTAAESIQKIAEQLSGYAAAMDFQQNDRGQGAGVSIRIPAAEFDQARAQIKKLALRVSSEQLEASDVTREYTDMESALRNYRAEEAQYLLVMRRATAVKDILEVSEHLSDVRGEIERAEGEFRYLSHQVAMASIEIRLHTESEAQVLGIEWRPLYRLRVSFRNGVQSLVDYFDGIAAFLLKLPAIALWVATFVFFLRYGWKALDWAWKKTATSLPQAPRSAQSAQG